MNGMKEKSDSDDECNEFETSELDELDKCLLNVMSCSLVSLRRVIGLLSLMIINA